MGSIFALLRELFFMLGYVKTASGFPKPLGADEERSAIEALSRGDEQARRNAVYGRCEILEGSQAQAVYTSLKLHVERDEEVRGVIAAVNDAVELRSFQEIIPSMNDIFIRAVNGNL